jgi:cytochrome c peroxidase
MRIVLVLFSMMVAFSVTAFSLFPSPQSGSGQIKLVGVQGPVNRISLDEELGNSSGDSKPRFRPTAIAMNHSETLVVVSSSDGQVAVLDANSHKLLRKFSLGEDLRDVVRASWNAEGCFLTVDQKTHQLIKFKLNDDFSPEEVWRVDVCRFPRQICVDDSGLIAVTGHWSRQVTFVKSSDWNESHKVLTTVDLDFVPGEIAPIGNRGEFLVADAYSNRMATVRPEVPDKMGNVFKDRVTRLRELPDRRVGGMCVSRDRIVMATQMLNPLARSTRNDVHWGLMVSNDVAWFPEEKFLSDDFNFSKDRKQQPVGGAGDAKSDAECIVVTHSNLMVIALGGAKQVAVGNLDDFGFAYIYVGRRPVDLVIDSEDKFCFVANQLDGSVSVLRLEDLEVATTVELDEDRDYSLAEQGERLFFDASLSHDGWMSCHSCHVNGHTNGLINDNLSDETFGTPKRVLSLLGHGDTAPMAWNGGNESLEEQVHKSIKVTMQSDTSPTEEQVNAIAAFVRQLPPPPSLDSARQRLKEDKVAAGLKVFHELKCNSCHSPPNFTSPDIYEVGLEDEKGEQSFNPPSLIGLGQRDAFFHDERAKSLEEVFSKIGHQVPNKLPDEKLSNLVTFLKSL